MFKKILFCTDFSENAHWAFTYALKLARTFQSKLLILHVTPEPIHPEQLTIYLSEERLEELKASQKKELDKNFTVDYLQKMEGFKDYHLVVVEGEPFYEIIQLARKESVDLIVMGTHGRTGLDHVLFGSTAERVVRKAPCPVLTIRLPGKQFVMP
jgi:nucleotide-binding universal stress UspA family protein